MAENSSFLALTVATAAVAVEVHGMAIGRLITGMVVSLTGSGCNFCIYSVFSSSVRPCHLEVSLDSPSSCFFRKGCIVNLLKSVSDNCD